MLMEFQLLRSLVRVAELGPDVGEIGELLKKTHERTKFKPINGTNDFSNVDL